MSLEHRMEDPRLVREFILAGNARFTIVSETTGSRFTYRVNKHAERDHWFVSLLTGSDNEADYSYMGMIKGSRVVPTRASRTKGDAPSFKAIDWFWNRLNNTGQLPKACEFWHEGKCGRCARPLTVPASIASGFGPECIKHL